LLLIRELLIRRDEDLEASAFCRREQLPVW
jgi:hypothetical protein